MRLYVNIDHVATVREARRTDEPDPVRAAAAAERGGADGITVHLREDRRHIQDADVRALRGAVRSVLNLELGAGRSRPKAASRSAARTPESAPPSDASPPPASASVSSSIPIWRPSIGPPSWAFRRSSCTPAATPAPGG